MSNQRPRQHLLPVVPVGEILAPSAGQEPPVLLDVQWALGRPGAGRAAYVEEHLPGALFVDLDTVLAGPVGPGGGRHPMPDPIRLQEGLRVLGLQEDSDVVVYDGGEGLAAARAWWVLTWAGLARTRILDGGLPAWRRAGGKSDAAEVPPPPRSSLIIRPGSLLTLDADEALAMARDGVLLDARTGPRYAGEHEPVDPVGGHIPGARSAPMSDVLAADGTYRPVADLRAHFAEHGVGGDATTGVGAYCGSGVSAAVEVVALRLVGVDAALYVGSWSDWVSDPSRPVATGGEQQVTSPG